MEAQKTDQRPAGETLRTGEKTGVSNSESLSMTERLATLCSCGRTENPPFCDGSHAKP
jgi:CDGSH-type Zn-finger protein